MVDIPPAAVTPPFSPLEAAGRLADDVLFLTALATDASGRVPRRHLDRLADAGLYGPSGLGDDIVEVLAGGCLSTTFVWLQHHGALRAVAATPGLRERWLEDMELGKWRAGVAIAGIRPGVEGVSAQAVDGGWRVNGVVPWVSGWGMIDVVLLAARRPGGDIVWAIVDAAESPTLTCQRQRLIAVDASVTVTVSFHDHFVPDDRVTGIESYDAWISRDARGLRTNGSLALGVAGRCCRLLGAGPLDQALVGCRVALDRAAASNPDGLPAARAAAAHLAQRAAAALVVAAGSRAVLMSEHPQRLAREAMFLLAFGSRPAIARQLGRLFGSAVGDSGAATQPHKALEQGEPER